MTVRPTYRYKINDYTELCIADRESGGVELIISKDRGNRVEWIGVPAADVDEVVRQIREHAGARAPLAPAPLYSGCAFCDDDGAEDHVRCYCTRDCRKRGCGFRPQPPQPGIGPFARSVCGRCGRRIGQAASGAWFLTDEIDLDSECSHVPGGAS
jgi:hypothetical protein